jgi:hypothetical protein
MYGPECGLFISNNKNNHTAFLKFCALPSSPAKVVVTFSSTGFAVAVVPSELVVLSVFVPVVSTPPSDGWLPHAAREKIMVPASIAAINRFIHYTSQILFSRCSSSVVTI